MSGLTQAANDVQWALQTQLDDIEDAVERLVSEIHYRLHLDTDRIETTVDTAVHPYTVDVAIEWPVLDTDDRLVTASGCLTITPTKAFAAFHCGRKLALVVKARHVAGGAAELCEQFCELVDEHIDQTVPT